VIGGFSPPWCDLIGKYLYRGNVSEEQPIKYGHSNQPALARRDVSIQLFSLIMNASLCSTASCHARSGPGVWARDWGRWKPENIKLSLSSFGSLIDAFSGTNDGYGDRVLFNIENYPVFWLSTEMI